jgi:hypothetical protein
MKAAASSKRPYASTKLHGVKNHTSYCKQFFGGGRDVIAGLGGVPQVLPTQQRLIFEGTRRTALNGGVERIRQLYWLLHLVIDHRDESLTWVAAAAAASVSCIQRQANCTLKGYEYLTHPTAISVLTNIITRRK